MIYCISKANYVLKNINKVKKCIFVRNLNGLHLWDEEISSEIKHKIENHWRPAITTKKFDRNDLSSEKYYVLSMFPYPSGFLHMGHVRVYTISDVVARFQRMNGKNVIHPIGWDAFGLPAENAAIDRKIAPDKWTKDNIDHMKKQLNELGCSFEWDRELATCDPEYYKWTQDLFIKLYEAGLVYQKEATVNWDPVDQTVLADEQVDENGCSWRSGAKVEKKLLKQWFIRTTRFAKDLLNCLDDPILQDWRDIIKLQKHWIGECNGVNFDFKINKTDSVISKNDSVIDKSDSDKIVISASESSKTDSNNWTINVMSKNDSNADFVTLWTDKPEFIEHVKFVAVSDGHFLAKKEDVKCGETLKLKVELVNPFSNEKVPVYCTSEIEFLPLTDSYLGIPGASEEASIFAKKHNIPYAHLPQIENGEELNQIQNVICQKAKQINAGGYWSSAKLRDWLISRQRYWGTPIPIVHCQTCGSVPVSKDQLPVELPKLDHISQKGGSQLGDIKEWVNTECPKCKSPAKRDTDTMDTFVDSSWYFLRYLSPKNDREMFDKSEAMRCMPVDLYIGGKEHAVLHLYYARFINHFLYSLGLVPEKEPFKRLLVQGMVMGRSFKIKKTGEYVPQDRVKILDLKRNKAVIKDTNEPVTMSWEKMSKSKHNGVDPQDMFKEYGIDTTRLLILADVSPTSHRNWNSNTFPGVLNWQRRLWLTIKDFLKHRNNLPAMIPEDKFKEHEDYMFDSRNYYIKGVTFNYLISQQLSVAVSKQQGLTNSLRKVPPSIVALSHQYERALAAQLTLLAPMAPYFASELWSGFVSAPNRLNVNSEEIQWDKTVLEQNWPETDWDYQLDLVCQVNGYENCIVKYTRKELENLTKEEAFNIAVQQKEVQNVLVKRNVLDSTFKIHSGCEGIINILTDQPVPTKKVQVEVVEN